MSFKIFTFQLTGKIRDTEKIESARKLLQDEYQAFLEAGQSEELKEYQYLEKWMASGEYERRKKEVESLVFKGSLEFNQLKEFNVLRKNRSIRQYFAVSTSGDLKRFAALKDSDQLKLYWDLKDYVKAGQYHQDKSNLLAQKFEGSSEEGHLKELAEIQNSKAYKAYIRLHQSSDLKKHFIFGENGKLHRYTELKNAPEKDKAARREFRKLKNDPEIRAWFRFENSKELKYYHEMSGSHTLARLEELKKLTGTEEFKKRVEFLKDKKKLEKSEAWRKFSNFRELDHNEDIRFFRKYEHSPLYRNYLDIKDSYQLKRYHELENLTTSAEFLERKAYLEDPKKWEKTEEFARHQRYLLMKKNPKVLLHFKYVNSHAFDFLKQWEVSFEDQFEGKSINSEKWTPNSYWADRLLGDNFSQTADLQVYTGGKNCQVNQSKLSILVKKEKAGGKRWLPGQGFVPDTFEYTSDTLSSIRSFWQNEGIFEAKIRFNPVRQVVQSFHLLGEFVTPQITLMEAGPECRSGVLHFSDGRKPVFQGIGLKNLKKDKFYLFRLEWKNDQLTWKMNDQIIYEARIPELKGKVHLNLTSLVVNEVESSRLPVAFEIDWVRCYHKKT